MPANLLTQLLYIVYPMAIFSVILHGEGTLIYVHRVMDNIACMCYVLDMV